MREHIHAPAHDEQHEQPRDSVGAGPIASLLGLSETQTAELRRLLSPRPVE